MKILTKQDGEKWLLANNLPTDLEKLRFLYKNYLAYELKPYRGIGIVLAKSLINIMNKIDVELKSEGVFWITDREGSYENMNLFDGYRKSLNESRSLDEVPFHVFEKSDLNALECLLDLVFYFGWSAYLISPNREIVVYINEDWFVDVTCKKEDDYKPYRELFERMEFKKIKKSL